MQTFVFVGDTTVGTELASNLLEAGLRSAEGVAQADVVFTFTPFLDDTEDVYFGTDGLVTTAKPGVYLVNLAAATPSLSQEISALCQVNDLKYVEAPLYVNNVVREHAFADKDNVSAFVGGADADVSALQPVFDALCATVVRCGEVGTGQLAACAAVLQRAANVVGIIEADALCRVVQGDAQAASVMAHVLAVQQASPEDSALYAAITARSLAGSYTAATMIGELSCALTAADDSELILPQAEAAEYLLQMLCTIGGHEFNPAATSLLYAEEQEAAKHGLDWARADEALEAMGDPYGEYDDDWDDGWDGEDDDAHGHHHGFGLN